MASEEESRIVRSRVLGQALCEMFQMDPKGVTHIELSLGVDDVARIIVERIVRTSDGKISLEGDAVKKLVQHYELVEKK